MITKPIERGMIYYTSVQKNFKIRAQDWNNTEVTPLKEPKRAGRPRLLNEPHRKNLEKSFTNHPSASLDQAKKILTSQFSELEVTNTTV